MNDRQERFCQEYLVDLNATQAAIRAGYSRRSAYTQAQRLLKNDVKERIAELQQARAERTEINIDRTVREIAAIAYQDLSAYITIEHGVASLDLSKLPPDAGKTLKKLTQREVLVGSKEDGGVIQVTDVETHDKLKALDMLMKHLGGYAPIQHALTDTDGNDVADPRELLRARMESIVARLSAQDGTGQPVSDRRIQAPSERLPL